MTTTIIRDLCDEQGKEKCRAGNECGSRDRDDSAGGVLHYEVWYLMYVAVGLSRPIELGERGVIGCFHPEGVSSSQILFE